MDFFDKVNLLSVGRFTYQIKISDRLARKEATAPSPCHYVERYRAGATTRAGTKIYS